MKKILLLLPLLLLAACSPDQPDPVALAIQESAEAVERSMIPDYPYFKEWEMCIINGETLENVSFIYTDLGLGYMHNDAVYYRLNMEVEYCERAVLQEE